MGHASDDAGVANARLNATLTFAGMSPPPFGKNRDADESYDVSGAEFKLYARTLKQDTRCERELRQRTDARWLALNSNRLFTRTRT